MCGIAGVIKIHDPKDGPPPSPLEAIPESWLDILDDSIKHRGPDGQGRFRDRATRDDGTIVDVALVHRRLSIIDHQGGHQPMVHDGQRLRPDLTYQPGETPIIASEVEPDKPLVAVVFNGCIYNHRELRQELEEHGHVFETDHSDTEVLVHGWRAWRFQQICELDGMYAAMTWERAKGQLSWGRDHAGEKPIYAGTAYFLKSKLEVASSVPAACFLLLASISPSNDNPLGISGRAGALDGWITYGSDCNPPPDAVQEVLPDGWILPDTLIDGRSISLLIRDKREMRFEPLIESAVQSRLEADVPLGIFLSGGIDSALIASITHKHRPDVQAFTVRMPVAQLDESQAASETARHIGIEHHILDCEPKPAEDLIKLIEQLGLPFGDSSLLPTYWVSKAAREHVKVALSGDGGDELFGGYRRHSIAPKLNRWHRLLSLIPSSLLNQRQPGSRSTYLARLAIAARHSGYCELLAIFSTPDLQQLEPSMCVVQTELDGPSHDFISYLPNDLLRKTDTASMAVGLEVRAPFLARDLVEAAMRTPLDMLMPNGERKGLLKQVARKYLPDHIVDRPKQGFAIPIGDWFRTDYGDMRQLLLDHLRSTDPFPGLGDAGVNINMKFVEQMIRQHDAAGEKSINPWHGRDHSQRLYMLLVLSIWCKWLKRVQQDPDQKNPAQD